MCKAFIAVCALERSLTRMGAFVLHRGREQEEREDKRREIQFVCLNKSIKKTKKQPEYLSGICTDLF